MTVTENTTTAVEGLFDVFKNLGKKRLVAPKKKKRWRKSFKNPGPALGFTANAAIAVASSNPKAASSKLPDVTIF